MNNRACPADPGGEVTSLVADGEFVGVNSSFPVVGHGVEDGLLVGVEVG